MCLYRAAYGQELVWRGKKGTCKTNRAKFWVSMILLGFSGVLRISAVSG